MLKFPAFFKIERRSLPLEPQKQTRAMNTGEPMIPLAASSASGLLDFIDILSWKKRGRWLLWLGYNRRGVWYGWQSSENLPRIDVSKKSHEIFLDLTWPHLNAPNIAKHCQAMSSKPCVWAYAYHWASWAAASSTLVRSCSAGGAWSSLRLWRSWVTCEIFRQEQNQHYFFWVQTGTHGNKQSHITVQSYQSNLPEPALARPSTLAPWDARCAHVLPVVRVSSPRYPTCLVDIFCFNFNDCLYILYNTLAQHGPTPEACWNMYSL